MKKSRLIKIIKEEIQSTVSEYAFGLRLGSLKTKQKQVPILSTLAKIGRLQTSDATKDYYAKTKLDTSEGLVHHYFKKDTPGDIIDTAKNYVERGASGENQYIKFLKDKGIQLVVKAFTGTTVVDGEQFGGKVQVNFKPTKEKSTPAQDGQRPVVTTAPDSGEE